MTRPAEKGSYCSEREKKGAHIQRPQLDIPCCHTSTLSIKLSALRNMALSPTYQQPLPTTIILYGAFMDSS